MGKSEIIHKCSACINLTDKTTSWYTQYCFDIIGKKIRDFGQCFGATSNLESDLIRAHVLVAASGVGGSLRYFGNFLESYCGVRHL